MKMTLIASASVLALAAFGLLAPERANAQQNQAPAVQSESGIARDMDAAEDSISKAVRDVTQAAKDMYEKIEYTFFSDEPDIRNIPMAIDARATAEGMLGESVVDQTGRRVGTLEDIILDDNGQAILAVVSDAGLINIGAKEAAFDYAMIVRQNADGDIVMPLTDEAIKAARKFSYDTGMAPDEKTRTMPKGGHSVAKILDAEVFDQNQKSVADVDNIIFRNGYADTLIIGFNKIIGMGGSKAAMTFSKVGMVVRENGATDFQLTEKQATRLAAFKHGASH